MSDFPEGFIEALRRQTRLDEDGEEVGVSRQAVDTAIELLEAFATNDRQKTNEINTLVKENRAYVLMTTQTTMLCATVNALLHQIDIGDFLDENGHNAKMLKPTHDLMMIMSGDKFQLAGLLQEHEEDIWNNAIGSAIEQFRAEFIYGYDGDYFPVDMVPESLARLKK